MYIYSLLIYAIKSKLMPAYPWYLNWLVDDKKRQKIEISIVADPDPDLYENQPKIIVLQKLEFFFFVWINILIIFTGVIRREKVFYFRADQDLDSFFHETDPYQNETDLQHWKFHITHAFIWPGRQSNITIVKNSWFWF